MTGLDASSAAADVVSAPVSTTPPEIAEKIALECYGLRAAARRLSSERDENFHLVADRQREFLLKLTNAAEAREVTDFQTKALRHVAQADAALPIPHLIAAADGRYEALVAGPEGQTRVVRLLTYLRGDPLHAAPRSLEQCGTLGRTLGRLDLALRGFAHPAGRHPLRWDLSHAATLRPLLALIENPVRRGLATRFLDNFEEHAQPMLPALRAQVIHNDFQPSNVLVDPDEPDVVTGVIDFGDLVQAPLVNDLAVACAYHVATAPEALDYVLPLVRAYHTVLPLLAEEMNVFADLMATRLVLTTVITNWRVTLHPDNRAYVLRNAPGAWRGLERLASWSRTDLQTAVRRACVGE